MKTRLTILTLLLLSTVTFCQESHRIYNEDGVIMDYMANSLKSRIPLFLQTDRVLTSKPFCQPLANDSLGTIIYLENSDKARLSVRLRKDSLKYYRYSVIENDTSLIVNHKIPDKINEEVVNTAQKGYLDMDLGISHVGNKKITVKIYRLPDTDKVNTLILYNKPLKRATIWSYKLLTASGINNKNTQSTHMTYGGGIHVDEKTRGILIAIIKTDIDSIYRMRIIRTSPDSSHIDFAEFAAEWKYDDIEGNPSRVIDARYFNKPGDYKVYISPQFGRETNVSEVYRSTPQFVFKVLSVAKVYSTKDILSILGFILVSVSFVVALVIFIMRKRGRNKLRAAQKKAEIAKGELDQIRARLNPHFVYNSLSGIQNLMNQNETEKANAYLSKFARLTRNILNEEKLISIQEERGLLEDYLSMESLRFKFSYEINTTSDNNFLNTEIPAMLLQPFVENAVKHNMATLQDEGKLLIELTADKKNLILSVKDNGPGFDTQKTYDGLGLKLCRKRIELLKELYKECPISMNIDSGNKGTTVTIILENWL